MRKAMSSVLVLAMLGVFGCATNSGNGALIGGTAGAGLGALLCRTNRLACAALGGIAGSLIGLAVGHYMDKQKATRKEVIEEYDNRKVADGTVYVKDGVIRKDLLEVEKARVDPLPIKVGGDASAIVQYSAVSQYANGKVAITEARYIVVDGDNIPICQARAVDIAQGTHLSAYKFHLPSGIEAGYYEILTVISGLGQTKRIITPITVQG